MVHYQDGGVPGRRRVLTGAAAETTFNDLPKIDFRRLYSNNLSDRQSLAYEMGVACRDGGFFYAADHGVDESLLDDTFDALKRFFNLPKEVKIEVRNQKSPKIRGYKGFLEGKLDPSTRGDLKEGFPMGEDATHTEQNIAITPSTSEPRIFALALNLPETAFDAITTHPMTNVRAVHYPPQESESDVSIGAHTNFCWFTLVCQSHTAQPALEVLNAKGIWVLVHHEQHTFVVNIADFFKLVTERYSTLFSFSPDEDAKVSVLEQFRKKGEVYGELGVGEYFQKRLEIDRMTHLDGEECEKKGALRVGGR
ncbi:2OG-Fe(II) oxygenase [Didymella exigua CBS 183.55]|uniref:2OG-Fe(II) oxygenase n=1 Tax=Didymella exigua CBS 183.55 TaxID=1150837 RepID=A0A6A5RQS8_9PLEO|nr:2OG-Fe(II) oxygenase [Didymella exigua CBS 183.55]KAF1929793.1 2OG-Fe(II) oxygenase [Didymella exigua CBS 183.55]